MAEYYTFNEERLNFRYIPKEARLSAQMINEFNNHFGNLKKHQNLIKSMGEGIRMNPDITVGGYLCVICDNEPFPEMDQVTEHLANKHQEPLQLLRTTSVRPIVGLDLIIEYRNEMDEICEYECTLCSLFFSKLHIFWHIISLLHKEKFAVHKKLVDESIVEIVDLKEKHERVDEALLKYEESQSDRGYFLFRRFQKGMIESVTPCLMRLNMTYISKLYPTEENQMQKYIEKEERWLLPIADKLELKIYSEQQFNKGKDLLMKMNRSLLDYFESGKTDHK